jgi:hypothetical protein
VLATMQKEEYSRLIGTTGTDSDLTAHGQGVQSRYTYAIGCAQSQLIIPLRLAALFFVTGHDIEMAGIGAIP